MKQLSNVESRLYKYCGYLMDLFFMNLFFLLSCLPIITIGASCIALAETTQKMVEGTLSFPTRTYFKSWRENFIRGFLIQIVLMLYGFILILGVISLFRLPWLSFILAGSGLLFAMIYYILFLCYAFQYNARYNGNLLSSFKVVFQVLSLNPKYAGGPIIITLTILSLISLKPVWSIIFSFFMLMIGFSVFSLALSTATLKLFKKYEKINK